MNSSGILSAAAAVCYCRHFLQCTVLRLLTVSLAWILNDGRFAYKNNVPFPGGGITASQTGRQIPDQFINLLQNKLLSMDGSHELNQSKFHFLTFMLLFKCDNVHLFSMSSFYGFTALSGQ